MGLIIFILILLILLMTRNCKNIRALVAKNRIQHLPSESIPSPSFLISGL